MVELNIHLIAIVVIAIVIIYFVTFRTEHYTATNAQQSSVALPQQSAVATPQQKPASVSVGNLNVIPPQHPMSTDHVSPQQVGHQNNASLSVPNNASVSAPLNKPFYVEPSSGLYTGGLYLEGQYNYDADKNRQNISQISNDTNNFRELVITGNAYRDGKTRQVGIYDKLNVYGELCVGNEREQVCMGMNELKNIGKLVTNQQVGAGAFQQMGF